LAVKKRGDVLNLLIEKAPDSSAKYYYVLAHADSLPDVFAAMEKAEQDGFTLLGIQNHDPFVGSGV
jgi:hypothetical protein